MLIDTYQNENIQCQKVPIKQVQITVLFFFQRFLISFYRNYDFHNGSSLGIKGDGLLVVYEWYAKLYCPILAIACSSFSVHKRVTSDITVFGLY